MDTSILVRKCVETLNNSTTEWIDKFYSANAEWIEHPTISFPKGRSGNREDLRKAEQERSAIFPNRKLIIINQITEGNQSVLELVWEGIASRKIGSIEPGTVLRSRISSYFIVENGRIVKHTDYIVPY